MQTQVVIAPAGPAELLEQAAQEFAKGEHCHRRHLLQAGRLAHEFIVAARAQGQERDRAVKAVAARLAEVAGQAVQVNRLIGSYHVSALLAADRAAEDIPHRTLREFIPLLKRNYATDAWSIRPEIEPQARELFRHAVAEGWDAAAIADAVRELRGKRRPVRDDGEENHRNPLAHLCNADPRDAAEALAEVIAGHLDPAAVVGALAQALDWQPAMGTALARALLDTGAYKTANAVYLALKAEGGAAW